MAVDRELEVATKGQVRYCRCNLHYLPDLALEGLPKMKMGCRVSKGEVLQVLQEWVSGDARGRWRGVQLPQAPAILASLSTELQRGGRLGKERW